MYSINSKISKLNWWQRILKAFDKTIYEVEQDNDLAFYKQILDEIPQLVCIKNKEGRYTYVNTAFSDMVATPAKYILGKNDYEPGFFLNPTQIWDSDLKVFETGQKKHIPVEPFTDKFGNLF